MFLPNQFNSVYQIRSTVRNSQKAYSSEIYLRQSPRMKEGILTRQTMSKARGNGNRNPERMLRKIEPGMAKVCKL